MKHENNIFTLWPEFYAATFSSLCLGKDFSCLFLYHGINKWKLQSGVHRDDCVYLQDKKMQLDS